MEIDDLDDSLSFTPDNPENSPVGHTDSENPRIQEEERSLRPPRLDDFIGQQDLKDKLIVSIQAARKRSETLDHCLFSGPPGLGKTTLACIIAAEMGGRFHSTAAPALSKPRDLAKLLTLLETGDTLFIDEIHRLNRQCEEILYPAMEDGYIDFIIGEGVTAQSIKVNLKPFTLIGATTRSGMLSTPLKARFGIEFKMEYYEKADIERIVERSADILGLPFSPDAAGVVAERARMTPRVANRLLRRVRDYATVDAVTRVEGDFAANCLEHLGIDVRGLTDLDRKILKLMIERYRGGPVGIKTLAALVDEEERTLEEDHEPFLLRMGLMEKTPQGRMATRAAYEHLGHEFIEPSGASGGVKNREQPGLF